MHGAGHGAALNGLVTGSLAHLSNVVALVGTTLVGLFVGLRFSEPAMLEVLAKAFLAILLVSFAVIALAPGYAIEPFDRGVLPFALKGAARHRNSLGAQAALIITFVGATSLTGALTRTRGIVIGGLACVVLVLAQSMTALVAAVGSLLVLLAFWAAKQMWLPLASVMAAILALAAVAGCAFLLESSVVSPKHSAATLTSPNAISFGSMRSGSF